LVQDEIGVRVPNNVESQSLFRRLLSRLRQGVEETSRLLEE